MRITHADYDDPKYRCGRLESDPKSDQNYDMLTVKKIMCYNILAVT